jgi:hypothetical protein
MSKEAEIKNTNVLIDALVRKNPVERPSHNSLIYRKYRYCLWVFAPLVLRARAMRSWRWSSDRKRVMLYESAAELAWSSWAVPPVL